MAEAKSDKYEVVMKTQNPVHEVNFKWIIENVTKFCRKLHSSNFRPDTECKPEFRLVAKFNERYSEVNVNNVTVGLERIDSGEENLHVNVDVQLQNTDGDEYCRKEFNFTCKAGGTLFYMLSELFSDSANKLTLPKIPTGLSSEDSHDQLHLTLRSLVASHGNVGSIFIIPNDILVVKGRLKVLGCCVSTDRLAVPYVQEKLSQQKHANYLLQDLKYVYENQILTDVVLVSGYETIKAHKFVLQSRSPVFKSMFEHDTKEKEDGVIKITDIDFPVLEALIWYLYTGVVQKLPYINIYDLYEAADKYQVQPLQRACSEILRSFVSDDSVCRILVLADLHNDKLLKEYAVQYITRNFAEIKMSEHWQTTLKTHQRTASDVLERIFQLPSDKASKKR